MVTGSNMAYNVALITPNWDKLMAWAHANAEGLQKGATKVRVTTVMLNHQ